MIMVMYHDGNGINDPRRESFYLSLRVTIIMMYYYYIISSQSMYHDGHH